MTESPSVTTFVVDDRLPWPDDAFTKDGVGPFDAAVIYDAGVRRECSIRRISASGVTLRSDLEKAPGDPIAIELGTGQRLGTVAWADRGELGISFDEPVDMVALLNRTLVSQPVERRAMPRVEIRCSAYLKFGENFCPVTLRNISARGLQVEGDQLPECGTYVSVLLEGLNVPPGEVVWKRDKLAGIEVFEELSWTSIIPWIKATAHRSAN